MDAEVRERIRKRFIIACDEVTADQTLALAGQLGSTIRGLKLNSLFIKWGPKLVEQIRERGASVFLDLKIHDIPNTMRNSAAEATRLGVERFTVHTLVGRAGMTAAVEGVELAMEQTRGRFPRPLVLGITILTHQTLDTLRELLPLPKNHYTMAEIVIHLATVAKECGLDGVVCSPEEVGPVRRALGTNFHLVTPGIRPIWYHEPKDDQARTSTPLAALQSGASNLVIGRPFTKHPDRFKSVEEAIEATIDEIVISL